MPSSSDYDAQAAALSDTFAQLKVNEASGAAHSEMAANRYQDYHYPAENSAAGIYSNESAYEASNRFNMINVPAPPLDQGGTYEQYSTAYDPYAAAASNILGSGPITNTPSYSSEAYDVYPYNLSNDGVNNVREVVSRWIHILISPSLYHPIQHSMLNLTSLMMVTPQLLDLRYNDRAQRIQSAWEPEE